MWNSFDTAAADGMTAAVVTYRGAGNDDVHAYVARPDGRGLFPGIVLVHHLPGWDELYREFTRRFAQHGYNAICPDLYCRDGHGRTDEVAAKVRSEGGAPDQRVVDDRVAAMRWLKALPTSNGKVGIIGTCSGGRHAFLTGARSECRRGPLGRSRRDGAVRADAQAARRAYRPHEEPERTAARTIR